MKNHLRKLMLVVASLGLILSGCEKDLYEDTVIQKNQNFKIENKSFKEMSTIANFKQPLDKVLHTTTFDNVANKTVLEELYNFTIMEENPVRILTNGNKTSYILCIKRTVKEQLVFENLILEQESGNLKALIAKYTLNEKPEKSLVDDSYIINLQKAEINELSIVGQTANHSANGCWHGHWTMHIAMCNNDGGGHAGDPHLAGEDCTNENFLYTEIISGFTSENSSGGNTNAGTGNQETGSSGDSGSNQSGDSGNTAPNPIIFAPFIPLNYTFSDTFQILDAIAQQNVINYISEHPTQENNVRLTIENNINLFSLINLSAEAQRGVTAYLAANNFTQASQTVANQFIANPNASSPVNVFIMREQINSQLNALVSPESYAAFTGLETNVKTILYNYGVQGVTSVNNIATFFNTVDNNYQTNWLTQEHETIQISLFNYLVQNNFNSQSTIFVEDCITNMQQNHLHIDVNSSSKSPFYIDKFAIDGTSPEGIKFNKIYGKLENVPQFKSLFTDMFGPLQDKFNVKFTIEDIPDDDGEFVAGESSRVDDNTILIGINSQILTPTGSHPMTNMEVAKTILHECIHAYLMVKALHPTVGVPIPNAGSMNVEQLLNAVYNVGTAHHNFMIQHMLPTMQAILTPLVYQLTTETKRAECENIGTFLFGQWQWAEYVKYLSYQGLEETTEFGTLFQPVFNSLNQIIGGNALYNNFNDYNTIGHDNLDRTLP